MQNGLNDLNMVTDILSKQSNFDFNFTKLNQNYSDIENFKQNLIKYANKLLSDYQKLSLNLQYVEINNYIKNPALINYKVETLKLGEQEQVEIFNFYNNVIAAAKNVIQKQKQDYFDTIFIDDKNILDFTYDEAIRKINEITDKLDKIAFELEKDIPQFVLNFINQNTTKLNYTTQDKLNFLFLICNSPIINSQSLNLAMGNFSDLFIKKVIEELLQTDDLECLIEIFSHTISPESRDYLLKIMVKIKENMFLELENVNKELLDKAFDIFFSNFSDDNLTQYDSLFLNIGNFIEANKTLTEEFTQNFYVKFGNIVSMPLSDLLKNSIVRSDNDLKTFCEVNNIDFKIFEIDILSRLNGGYYDKNISKQAYDLKEKIKGE